MLNVSDRALELLARSLDETEADGEHALRLARTSEGDFGIAVDGEQDGDQVVMQEDRPVLFVGQDVSTMLDGVTLDVIESDEGSRLTLRSAEEEESELED